MAKPGFDWAKLNRYAIMNVILDCRKLIVNKPLAIKEIHSIFASHLKLYFPVKVRRTTSPDTEINCIYIGGMYYSGFDMESKPCIEIILQYSLFNDILTISPRLFKRIAISITDTLLHEALHMKQYRSRKFKVLPDYASTAEKRKQRSEQSYLGCTDEIDSYGFNIACELNDKFKGNDTAIFEYLDKAAHRKVQRPDSWIKYVTAFDNDHNHNIIKKMKKRIIHYLPYAKAGSPFNPSDRLRQYHHIY